MMTAHATANLFPSAVPPHHNGGHGGGVHDSSVGAGGSFSPHAGTGVAHAVQLPPTSQSSGLCPPRAPRHAVIRSRVLMRRTAEGVRWSLPPDELLQVNDLSVATATTTGGMAASGCVRKTCQIGEGPLRVPIELVMQSGAANPGPRKRAPKSRIFASEGVDGERNGAHADSCGDTSRSGGGALALVATAQQSGGGGAVSSTAQPAQGGAQQGTAPITSARGRAAMRRDFPELTKELHAEIKDRLNSLQSSCRVADFKGNARAIRFFLKELGDVCNLLDIRVPDKPYRSGHNYSVLTSFARLMPPAVGAELPLAGDLPSTGFIAFSVVAAMLDFPWKFSYNSFTHRVCDCHTMFAGLAKGDCFVPADGGNPGSGQRIAKAVGASAEAAAAGVAGNQLKSAIGTLSSSAAPASFVAAIEKQIETMRRKERHLPSRLPDLGRILRRRFEEFTQNSLPALGEDFLGLPLNKKRLAASRGWERFIAHFESEVSMFDSCYTQFEYLFLDMAGKTVGSALDPVHRMTGPSSSLMKDPTNPFTEMQEATLCQRLGLLKRCANFGGQYNMVDFDSSLLVKARRIKEMDTYREVQDMSATLLSKFDALCQVLVELRPEQIHPELSENPDLKATVVALEKVWCDCHFVLQQDCLDFIGSLLDFIPHLSHHRRWQLWIAMQEGGSGFEAPSSGELVMQTELLKQKQEQEELLTEARFMLFETLPMLMYMQEVWHDAWWDTLTLRFPTLDYHTIDQEAFIEELLDQIRARGVSPKNITKFRVNLREGVTAAVTGSQDAIKELRDKVGNRSIEVMGSFVITMPTSQREHFRALFCVKDDRHHTLRRDFAKFDEHRFGRIHTFMLGEMDQDSMRDTLTVKYFKNLQRQLKEVAAFPIHQEPSAVVRAATSAEVSSMPQDPNDVLYSPEEQQERKVRRYKMLQARARWVCAQRVAQAVKPELFPKDSPLAKRGKLHHSMTRRYGSVVAGDHPADLHSSGSVALDSSQPQPHTPHGPAAAPSKRMSQLPSFGAAA